MNSNGNWIRCGAPFRTRILDDGVRAKNKSIEFCILFISNFYSDNAYSLLDPFNFLIIFLLHLNNIRTNLYKSFNLLVRSLAQNIWQLQIERRRGEITYHSLHPCVPVRVCVSVSVRAGLGSGKRKKCSVEGQRPSSKSISHCNVYFLWPERARLSSNRAPCWRWRTRTHGIRIVWDFRVIKWPILPSLSVTVDMFCIYNVAYLVRPFWNRQQ